MLRAGKEGHKKRVRGGRNRLAARGYRGRGGAGEHVEGGNKASADTGGGGRREWTLVQVESCFKTRREGGVSSAKRAVQLSLRVADGGGVSKRRLTGKISIKRLNVGEGFRSYVTFATEPSIGVVPNQGWNITTS